MIYLLLGIILGVLVRDIKVKTIEVTEQIKQNREMKGSTQFLEPVSDKEKWAKAENIGDLLK